MHNFPKATLVAILALLSPILRAQHVEWTARIDSVAHAALADGFTAGFSIAVERDGAILFNKGYGVTDIESANPADVSTVYNIASVAKIITAVGILKLVDEGEIDLDASLSSLLPRFPNREQGRDISLRQLLNHTSGLHDYVAADIERWKQSREPLTASFVLDYMRDRPLDFEPGTNWIYSNTGFYLAGMIIERVTGRPWGGYVLGEILHPLGLSSFDLCDNATDSRTNGYDVVDGFLVPGVEDSEIGIRGDAGLCATAGDLAKLPSALVRGGVLSDASWETMLSQSELANSINVDYGLGVALGWVDGHRLWGHLGGNGSSYVATLAHYPSDNTSVAVLVNTHFSNVGALQIEGEVARIVLDLGQPELRNLPLVTDALDVYSGTYVGDRGNYRYEIIGDGQRLSRVYSEDSSFKLPLIFQGNHTFARSDWPMDRFVFHVNGERATAHSVYYNGLFDGFYNREDP